MDTITRTFPLWLTSANTSTVIELCHFRDMTFDSDERVGIYLEAFFCNMSLKNFQIGLFPEFDGDESEAQKMSLFNAAENKSQKLGLRILTKKNNAGEWREKAEVILVNRGRKDYFDLLIPYLAKMQVRLLEKNDAIGVQLVDYGNGLLKANDFIEIEIALRVEISKKNSIEALEARMAALELALEGRLINLPSNSLLGRNTGTGIVEVLPQATFATPAQVAMAIAGIVNSAPTVLDTLSKLAAALGNDSSFATTMANALRQRVDLTTEQTVNGIKNFRNDTGTNWSRLIASNATIDGAAFIGSLVNVLGVFAHSFNLGAWKDLWLNSVGVDNGGRVFCGSTLSVGTMDASKRLNVGGDTAITGFTALGDNAAIKMKRLTGTTAGAQGGSSSVAHGLTGDKIIGLACKVSQNPNQGLNQNYSSTAGYIFDLYHDANNVVVINSVSNSSLILGKPFTILVTYIA